MVSITQQGLSSLKSEQITTNLDYVTPVQNAITFNGGYSFNYVNFLQGITDVKTKSFTNFYLTGKEKLTTNIIDRNSSISQEKFLTRLRTGGKVSLSVVPLLGVGSEDVSFFYNLVFNNNTRLRNLFEINFDTNEYCSITYTDEIGKFYFVLDDNNKGILKRSVLYDDTFDKTKAQYFRYIINDNRIILLKDKNDETFVVRSVGQFISGSVINNFSNVLFSTFALLLDDSININFNSILNTSYITYNQNDLTIDLSKSYFNLDNNFLLYRNLEKNTLNNFNIIVLKNQISENNLISISNNIDQGNRDLFNNRTYTSIGHNIDREEDEGLELNYVFYNKTYNIEPGINYFKTESSFSPLTQININDTKIAEQGAYASTIPIYSDKIYLTESNNYSREYTYLCTWLSGAPFTSQRIWVDRYYYPDITSKQKALSSKSIFNPTYDTYIENLIKQNSSINEKVKKQHFFDKVSDLRFIPNTTYRYDRIDLRETPLLVNKNAFDERKDNYFDIINDNRGFTLAFNIINYDTEEQIALFSRSNQIYGGCRFVFSRSSITLVYYLYDDAKGDYKKIEKTVPLIEGAVDNIIFSIDTEKGELYFFVNGSLELKEVFYPSYFTSVLYGDFSLNNKTIYESNDYIENIFLSFEPLKIEELHALVLSRNTKDGNFYLSLPGGMRNKVDNITYLNTLNKNQQSKSNYVDVYINNIGIDDVSLKNELQQVLVNDIKEDLPVNININSIKIIS